MTVQTFHQFGTPVFVINDDTEDMPAFGVARIKRNPAPLVDGNKTAYYIERPTVETPFSLNSSFSPSSTALVPAATINPSYVVGGPLPIRQGEVGVAYVGPRLRALVDSSSVSASILGPTMSKWFLSDVGWGFDNWGADPHDVLGADVSICHVAPGDLIARRLVCEYRTSGVIARHQARDIHVKRWTGSSYVITPLSVNARNIATQAVNWNVNLMVSFEDRSKQYIIDFEDCGG